MNLLATGVPALVMPYSRQREQPLRVERLKPYMPLQPLGEEELPPDRLARAIEHGLSLRRREGASPIGLDGAENTAAVLVGLGAAPLS
jgi:predicted glycosyltransferase